MLYIPVSRWARAFSILLILMLLAPTTSSNATIQNVAANSSTAIAQNAPPTPSPIHPTSDEELLVRRPYLNVRNVAHNVAGATYTYDFQIATGGPSDAAFASTIVVSSTTPISEVNDGFSVTFWQVPETTLLQIGATFYWRARANAIVAKSTTAGQWSTATRFSISSAPWSTDGSSWHLPSSKSAALLTGTFDEAFHAGTIGTHLHGGIDLAVTGSARASRSGRLVQRVVGSNDTTPKQPSVITLDHRDGRKSQYLHMRPLTTFPLGTFVNQGTELGTVSDIGVPGSIHLHFQISNSSGDEFFNPLSVARDPLNPRRIDPIFGWDLPASPDPIVSDIYLRSDRFLKAKSRGIEGKTFIIARTVDPAVPFIPLNWPPKGRRLAPYRVQFFVNNQELCREDRPPLCGIQFDTLEKGERETDYYAYETSAITRTNDPPYLMFFPWDTSKLRVDAGPQTIKVVSSDYFENQSQQTIRIGPWLDSQTHSVTMPPNQCSAPVEVPVVIRNENLNLTGILTDTYSLTILSGDIDAVLLKDGKPINRVTIENGKDEWLTLSIRQPGDAGGSVQVIATSSIVRDIRHAVSINVSTGNPQLHSTPHATSAAMANPCPAMEKHTPGLFYEFDVVARTGEQNLGSIGNGVSINDRGQVAFVSRSSTGQGLYVGDGSTTARNINPAFSQSPSRTFGEAVQLDNAGTVTAYDRVSGAPATTFIRRWAYEPDNQYGIVAKGGEPGDLYNSIFSIIGANNNSQVVFGALRGSQYLLVRAHDIVGIILIEVRLTTSWASCILRTGYRLNSGRKRQMVSGST